MRGDVMTQYRTSSEALIGLAGRIIDQGAVVGSRLGDRTLESTFLHFTINNPRLREILVPERKALLPAQIAETMWVLGGRDDIGWLSHYLPRVAEFSDDGGTWRGAYGPRLRNWQPGGFDQLRFVVDSINNDPNTRRAVISIYAPDLDGPAVEQGTVDFPCNNWLHFLGRNGMLDLHVATRSNDLIWGWSGINQFEWATLLEVVCSLTGLAIGRIHYAVSSLHVYERHWERARVIARASMVLPSESSPAMGCFKTLKDFDATIQTWFSLEEKARKGSLTNQYLIKHMTDPLLQAWLRVIAWYWSGDDEWLGPLAGTSLDIAARLSSPKAEGISERSKSMVAPTEFIAYADRLHRTKDAVYGDSWCRRGEVLGILANIARKVDRLGANDDTETASDTALDLMIYLAKYQVWQQNSGMPGEQHLDQVFAQFIELEDYTKNREEDEHTLYRLLPELFEWLSDTVQSGDKAEKVRIVNSMLINAFMLARQLHQDLPMG